MYCPEGFAEMNTNDQLNLRNEFLDTLNSLSHLQPARNLKEKWENIFYKLHYGLSVDEMEELMNSDEEESENLLLTAIIRFFRPEYIVPRTIEVGQKMEALGCGG